MEKREQELLESSTENRGPPDAQGTTSQLMNTTMLMVRGAFVPTGHGRGAGLAPRRR